MAEKDAYTSLDAVAQQVVETWSSQGLKVVFTNGVFDVLHVGHVAVLEAAASHGQKTWWWASIPTTVCAAWARAPTVPFTKKLNRARVTCRVAQRGRRGGV